MKFSREQIIGYIIVLVLFILCGFSIKFPLFAAASEKQTFFQSGSPIEIFFTVLILSGVYFLFTYFFPLSGIIKQLKTYQEPLQKVYNQKFDYWLKTLLYEEEVQEQEHFFNVQAVKNRIESSKISVLVEAAKLNDMVITTYIKHLEAQADAEFINAKSEMERTKAHVLKEAVKHIEKLPPIWQAYIISSLTGHNSEFRNDIDIQRDISEFVKDLKEQEVKKAKAETKTFEEKMKQEQKKYTSNDKV